MNQNQQLSKYCDGIMDDGVSTTIQELATLLSTRLVDSIEFEEHWNTKINVMIAIYRIYRIDSRSLFA